MSEHLLEVKHLKKSYPVYDNSGKLFAKKKHMCAVDDMSFFIEKGETYGPYFSVFPLGEEVFGFSIKGAKYPLTNHTLIPYDSLCVSNQFQEDEVTISFLNGIVILMETKDR